jgi:hypothetical protein
MVFRATVGVLALIAVFGAATRAGAGSFEDCGQRVIRDWYSGGRVNKVYPLPCYRAAIRALPDDVLQYTDASAAIERALESARRGVTTPLAGSTTGETEAVSPRTSSPAPKRSAPAARASPGPAAPEASAPPHDPARLASGPARETSEAGVPYPLIALAALSLVLLASGIAAGLARRRS